LASVGLICACEEVPSIYCTFIIERDDVLVLECVQLRPGMPWTRILTLPSLDLIRYKCRSALKLLALRSGYIPTESYLQSCSLARRISTPLFHVELDQMAPRCLLDFVVTQVKFNIKFEVTNTFGCLHEYPADMHWSTKFNLILWLHPPSP
jgi:hypothetical protein